MSAMNERTSLLDAEDIRILCCLQRDGRVSSRVLADAAGIDIAACEQRLTRLERDGYIAGYGARISLRSMESVMTVFAQITLSDHRKENTLRFERFVEATMEIVDCHLISGGFDYLLKYLVRDVDHYESLVATLRKSGAGVSTCLSYVATTMFATERSLSRSASFAIARRQLDT